jgi:hypothetical protein
MRPVSPQTTYQNSAPQFSIYFPLYGSALLLVSEVHNRKKYVDVNFVVPQDAMITKVVTL